VMIFTTSLRLRLRMQIIDVKNVFYVFYFKIKNAFLTFFIFATFFINKKRCVFVSVVLVSLN